MRKTMKVAAAIASAAVLAAALVGCGSQEKPVNENSSPSENAPVEQSGQATPVNEEKADAKAPTCDVTQWETVGDALAVKAGDYYTAGWDDKSYLAMFAIENGGFVRIMAEMTPTAQETLDNLDASAGDYDEKYAAAIRDLKLVNAQDLTDSLKTPSELNAYIGKTGRDLMEEGFEFKDYIAKSEGMTVAEMTLGHLKYNVTFNVTVPDDPAEQIDETVMEGETASIKEPAKTGEAIKDANITAIEFVGGADTAVDPTRL